MDPSLDESEGFDLCWIQLILPLHFAKHPAPTLGMESNHVDGFQVELRVELSPRRVLQASRSFASNKNSRHSKSSGQRSFIPISCLVRLTVRAEPRPTSLFTHGPTAPARG